MGHSTTAKKLFRLPRPRLQLVERLHALAHGARRLRDDPGGRQRGDEAALELRRSRIAPRVRVDEGREGEEGIVILRLGRDMRDGGGGLAGELAGAFGHGSSHDAHSGGVGK